MGPVFDELYVISDLHMGGPENRQVFTEGKLLADTINQISLHSRGKMTALCLNGDTVDFLAEENAEYFNPHSAFETLNQIMNSREPFNRVFLSFRGFVQKANHFLIIIMGNHEAELMLPEVREAMADFLSEGKPEVRCRIFFSVDESGYRCMVGASRVVCLHGDISDIWNRLDYPGLVKMASNSSFGNGAEGFDPPPGTKIVIDLLNQIRNQYPFVQLLLPLEDAALPILASLDQSARQWKILFYMVFRWGEASTKDFFMNLGQEESRNAVNRGVRAAKSGSFMGAGGEVTREGNVLVSAKDISGKTYCLDDLLKEAEAFIDSEEKPMNVLIKNMNSEDTLGVLPLIRILLKKTDSGRKKILKKVLEKMEKIDASFDINAPDDLYRWLCRKMSAIRGNQVDFIICGHTHLRKKVLKKGGTFNYFNSGTWVNQIPFSSPEIFARLKKLSGKRLDREKLDQVLAGLRAGSINDLKKISTPVKVCYTIPTVVKLWAKKKEDEAEGALMKPNQSGILGPV